MVRNYVRKTNRQKWSVELMQSATKSVMKGILGLNQACALFKLPKTTLLRHIKRCKGTDKTQPPTHTAAAAAEEGSSRREEPFEFQKSVMGRFLPVFTPDQEMVLVQYLKEMGGPPSTASMKKFRSFVFELAETNSINHPFNKTTKMAGKDWTRGFLERHPDLKMYLSLANPQPQTEDKAELLSQQKTAAKLALREQLEETLLQMPPLKPTPFPLSFYPNPESGEFMCLVGLDFVVDYLTKEKYPLKSPLQCDECSVDFACAWTVKEVEKDSVSSTSTICENCIMCSMRKCSKAQQTKTLKVAFLKALQQEREIDKMTLQVPLTKPDSPVSSLPSPSCSNQNVFTTTSTTSKQNQNVPLPNIPKTDFDIPQAVLVQMSKLYPNFPPSVLEFQLQHLIATGIPLHPSRLAMLSTRKLQNTGGKWTVFQNGSI